MRSKEINTARSFFIIKEHQFLLLKFRRLNFNKKTKKKGTRALVFTKTEYGLRTWSKR